MCITFIYTNPGDYSSKYKLVLINNRDEYYTRETQNASLKDDGAIKSIYGVDLAGAMNGTWLGISKKDDVIKLGNLANVTGEEVKGKQGRGPIVTNYINSNDSIEDYNKKLLDYALEFSCFNFLSVEIKAEEIKSFFISNTPVLSHPLELGYLGVGNSPLIAPFRKVEVGTEHFKDILEIHKKSSKDELISALMHLLKDDTKYFPDEELSARRQETAEAFSSVHIELLDAGYGTRTRTVILIDNENNVDYIEETMITTDPSGEWETTHLKLPNT